MSNANQVFQWGRLYRDGKLELRRRARRSCAVSVADDEERPKPKPTELTSSILGAIHIELPGEVRISLEGSVDPAVSARANEFSSLISVTAGARIWIAAGVTDMRRGFHGISASGADGARTAANVGPRVVFRGRRGDIVKVLWFNGDRLCLLAERLERGRFEWPHATSGTVSLSRTQLSMLLEGID